MAKPLKLVKSLPEGDQESPFTSAVIVDQSKVIEISIDYLPIDIELPCHVYAKIGEKFVLFRNAGDKLTLRRLSDYRERSNGRVYIPTSSWKALIQSLEERANPAHSTPESRVRNIRALLAAYQVEKEEEQTSTKREHFLKIQHLCDLLAKELIENPTAGIPHLRKNEAMEMYHVNHAVNTAIYAILLGRSLKFNTKDLKLLSLGALVHDIGNMFIPDSILNKQGPLTQEEQDIMKTHTLQGAEHLQQLGAPPVVSTVAYQHHERINGNGYPRRLHGNKIHPFAKIVAIADVFDAITSNRPHKSGASAAEALGIMERQEGLFDKEFIKPLAAGLSKLAK